LEIYPTRLQVAAEHEGTFSTPPASSQDRLDPPSPFDSRAVLVQLALVVYHVPLDDRTHVAVTDPAHADVFPRIFQACVPLAADKNRYFLGCRALQRYNRSGRQARTGRLFRWPYRRRR
jgi:hypothetical protein